jgi:undecaprenyl phosphate-alpha-L-ara4N flippase subunit ArnF
VNKATLSILITIILSLIGVAGDFFIKLAGNGKKFVELRWFFIGLIIYALTAFGWFFVMKNIKLSTLSVFYAISTVLFLTLTSVFYFKESLNIYEIAGIALAIVSIYLLKGFA